MPHVYLLAAVKLFSRSGATMGIILAMSRYVVVLRDKTSKPINAICEELTASGASIVSQLDSLSMIVLEGDERLADACRNHADVESVEDEKGVRAI